MINFRFHIISLTAVFLAFAVGLVLGTTFLDDATERALNRRLDTLEEQLGQARTNNAELQTQLDRFAEEDEALEEPLSDRLLANTLSGEPVLVVAPDGLEGDPVERVVAALDVAGADYVGTWRLTDRLLLDDDDEREDLATVLEVPDATDVDRLREVLSADLATALFGAIHTSDPDETGPGLIGVPAEPAEPARVDGLHEQGFLNYDLPEDADSDVVLLPSSNLRVVMVSGTGAVIPSDDVLLPTLADLTSDGPKPVVVTAPSAVEEDDEENADGITRLVADVRDEEALAESISTVDDLELVSGRLATILALQQAVPETPIIGHYGLGPGAQELLPPVPSG